MLRDGLKKYENIENFHTFADPLPKVLNKNVKKNACKVQKPWSKMA